MGGTIGFTVREKSGKEHRMFRWTNTFPNFFHSMKFIEQDERHLRNYLKVWYDMADAYESGDLEQFPMANAYVPGAGLEPVGYGLIVVDYQTMTILTMQSYSFVGHISSSTVGLSLRQYERVAKEKDQDQDEVDSRRDKYEGFKAIFSSGRINKVMRYKDCEIVDAHGLSLDDFLKGIFTDDEKYCTGFLDMSPWRVVEFPEDEAGAMAMKKEVEGLGFILTEQEEKGWDEFLERYKETD